MLIGGPKVTAAAGHAWRNSLMLALRAPIPVSVPCGATSTTPGTQAVVSRRSSPASSPVFHARANACITSDIVVPPVWWIAGGHQYLPNGSDEPSQAGCPPSSYAAKRYAGTVEGTASTGRMACSARPQP